MLRGESCASNVARKIQQNAATKHGDRAFCSSLLESEFEYVQFLVEHEIPKNVVKEHLLGATSALPAFPGPRVAAVDVNNDGAPDYILPVRIPGFGPRPCDAMRYVAVTPSKTQISDGELTKVLGQLPRCPVTIRPFHHNGRVYFETRTPIRGAIAKEEELLHEVFVVEHQRITKLCTFEYR
jgi:hypothetical protein